MSEIDTQVSDTGVRVKLFFTAGCSCLFFLAAYYVDNSVLPLQSAKVWSDVISLVCKTIIGLAGLIGALATIMLTFKTTFKHIWDSLVGAPLVSAKVGFSTSLVSITQDIKTASEAMYIFMRRYEDIAGDPGQRKTYHSDLLFRGICGLYGAHCKGASSLFSHICSMLVEPYANSPHYSQTLRSIQVSIYDKDHIKWTEREKYKIHHVDFPDSKKVIPYVLKYETSAVSSVMSIAQWADQFSLEIHVGLKGILKSSQHPSVAKEKPAHEGYFCWKEGNEYRMSFTKKILLSEEWTDISTNEVSLNSIQDVVYTVNMFKPTYGFTVEIELPDNFKIINAPRLEPEILYKAREDALGVDLTEDRKPRIDPQGKKNSIRMVCPEWLLPGLVMAISWEVE